MNVDANMRREKGATGAEKGGGRGTDRGKGPTGTFGFLTRFCTKWDFRPLKVKSGFDVES